MTTLVLHRQTVIGKRGNCWQAALASLLGLPLDEVPDFVNDPVSRPMWLEKSREFVQRRGHRLEHLAPAFPVPDAGPVVIAVGPSPRLEHASHAVLVSALDGTLVHDPHPDGTGLGEIEHVMALIES